MVLNQPQGGFRTPTPYDKELSSIARRERMAQIMQQQALQPLEINSFQGFQAPISPLQGLAKALQMYAGITAGDKADQSRAEIGKRMQTDAAQQIAGLEGTLAQPAIAPTPSTSFTPMGADFEDNPNLPIAASGNVEIAGTPGRAAIPAMPLGEAEKKQRLIQILTGGNPYSAPAAKFMLEDMQKSGTGPLAEYKLYSEQAKARGETPLSIDAYKTKQIQAGRAISNNVVNMPAGAPIPVMRNNKLVYIQMGKDGKFVEIEGISPPPTLTPLAQQLEAAGIKPTLEDGTPNPEFIKYAHAYVNKQTNISTTPGSINTPAGGTPPIYVPPPVPGGSMEVGADNKVIVTPTPGSVETASKFAGSVAGSEAGSRLLGTTQAQANLDLPKVVDNATTAAKHVRELLTHPGFKSSVGMGIPFAKSIKGTPQADFYNRLEQLKSGAFLTAIDTLRGTGTITEVEGAKATAAKNRMSTATSEKEFNDAAKDYLDIIEQGVKQTYLKADKPYSPTSVGSQPRTIDYRSIK
jgi:hypothetical protein